jgi:hypothetical protein
VPEIFFPPLPSQFAEMRRASRNTLERRLKFAVLSDIGRVMEMFEAEMAARKSNGDRY